MGVVLYLLLLMKHSVVCVLVIPLAISAGTGIYWFWDLIPGKEDMEDWKGIACHKGNIVTKSAVCKWWHFLWTEYTECMIWVGF